MTPSLAPLPEREPCDDAEVMHIWREVGLPEYFLGNGGTNHKLVAFAERIRNTALEEAAKVAEDALNNWSADLSETRNSYIEAQRSGKHNGRRIAPDLARRYAHDFRERSEAVADCGDIAAKAIRAQYADLDPVEMMRAKRAANNVVGIGRGRVIRRRPKVPGRTL